jgi:hypothetical protein
MVDFLCNARDDGIVVDIVAEVGSVGHGISEEGDEELPALRENEIASHGVTVIMQREDWTESDLDQK